MKDQASKRTVVLECSGALTNGQKARKTQVLGHDLAQKVKKHEINIAPEAA
ncbi:MAG: hypothetical protein H6576_13885 [Lewinellaceae bacterium]|nr:hypothetical protein [Lewinellaceae bacterium]